jgi:hypothetical protein
MNLNDYKLSKEEFDNLSTIDKREYILQTVTMETNWWLRTVTKITIVCIIIALFGLMILLNYLA